MTALYVALAGAAGVLSRHWISAAVEGDRVLWVTVAINVAGSFALGALAGAGASDDARAIAGVGFLGGFTTFSTFSFDVFADLNAGRPGRALAYVAASVLLGVAAAALGWRVARA